jgi:hypothetical protein
VGFVGRAARLAFWHNLANNRDGAFAVEDVVAFGDHAIIRWRYRMRLRDGLIVEALGYVKSGDASVVAAVRNATSSAR